MRNEYENEAFFQQYAQMSRSREGISSSPFSRRWQ